MSDLIARLEAATEGSRELDAKIEATNPSPQDWPSITDMHWEFEANEDGSVNAYMVGKGINKRFKRFPSARYTTSLDAALTLVPDKMFVELRRYSDGWYAYIAKHSTAISSQGFVGEQKAAALALAIAALKARASLPTSTETGT